MLLHKLDLPTREIEGSEEGETVEIEFESRLYLQSGSKTYRLTIDLVDLEELRESVNCFYHTTDYGEFSFNVAKAKLNEQLIGIKFCSQLSLSLEHKLEDLGTLELPAWVFDKLHESGESDES